MFRRLLLLCLLAATLPAHAGWFSSGVKVRRLSPQGAQSVHPGSLQIEFTEEVKGVGNVAAGFSFDPPVKGYAYVNGHQLTFNPSEGFAPATDYKFTFKTERVRSTGKEMADKEITGSFSTPNLSLIDKRGFFSVDEASGSEKELIIELVFNYPVAPEAVTKVLKLENRGKQLGYHAERGGSPERLYLKLDKLLEAQQAIVLTQTGTLLCQRCGKGDATLLKGMLTTPDRVDLEVKEFNLQADPSSTRATFLFSLPVSKAELQKHLSISPSIPFSLETEYLYGILKADFRPGTNYTLRLDADLKSKSGRPLGKDFSKPIQIAHFPRAVAFVDNGHLLAASGSNQVLVKSVNAKKIHAEVRKVYRNNLLRYLQTSDRDGSGALAWQGDLDVPDFAPDREQETALSLSKWQKQGYRGILLINLSPARVQNADNGEEGEGYEGDGENGSYDEDGRWRGYGSFSNYEGKRQRWVLLTDLGLVAKLNGKDLWVQVLRLSDLTPIPGAKIELLSQTNQVMQTHTTDAQGRLVLKDYAEGPEQSRAALLTASLGEDFAFLDLNNGSLAQERFDIDGDPFVADGLDAFLSSDRGLYRPGDTANFTAIVRHLDMSVVEKLPPLRLRIRDHEGAEVAKLKGSADSAGLVSFAFKDTQVPTGTYSADLGFEDGRVLRSTNIKIEEFIPQKIKVDIDAPKTLIQGQELEVTVKARMLFGADAPGLKVSGQVEWAPRYFQSAAFPGYNFFDGTRSFSGETAELPQGSTDAQGAYKLKLPFPEHLKPSSMLEARLYAEVMDDGGRPVSSYKSVEVHPFDHYLGLKIEGKDNVGSGVMTVKIAAVGTDGKAFDLKHVPITVRRKSWYSIFRRQHWRGQRWESTYYEEPVLLKDVELVNGQASVTFTPQAYGEYTVLLGGDEGPRASEHFYGGQNLDAGDMENADKLGLEFETGKLRAGETAKLRVHAPFAGRLLLTIEREKVYETRLIEVPRGDSVHNFKMEEEWMPNVYAVGLLTRKPDEAQRELPMVSFGVAPLLGNIKSRALNVEWQTPSEMGSKAVLQAKLKVVDSPGAKVVLAAVDEGILQVIGFESPDPQAYFYRKRGLTTRTWSTFRDVLPEILRKASIGGDEEAAMKKKHLNPVDAQRVKSMARYSGILTADAKGEVSWDVPLKGFQGQVRLMAIVVSGKRFAGAEKAVQVADEVVLESYLPRFLAPTDTVDVPVTVFNRGKSDRHFKVKLDTDGPLFVQGEASRNLDVAAGGQGKLIYKVKVSEAIGKAIFTATAYDGDAKAASQVTELAVRPAVPMRTIFHGGRLKAGESIEMPVPAGWLKTGQRSRLIASSDDLTRFAKKLEQLLAYPHGCAEQLTSQVFPLLYFQDVSVMPGKDEEKKAKAKRNVQFVVDRLQAMQAPDGGIDYWENPSESNPYLTRYVGHFLLEAERLGYQPNKGMMDRLKARLDDMPSDSYYWADHYGDKALAGEPDPYLLFVKALSGKPDKESMLALRDQRLKVMGADDRSLLSLAFSQIGDPASARKCLPEKTAVWDRNLKFWYGGSLGTPTKTVALYLNAIAAIDLKDGRIGDIIDDLAQRALASDYFHTQETAWMLMGVARATKESGFSSKAEWGVKGETIHTVEGKSFQVTPEQPSGKTMVLKNTGNATLNYSLSAEGYPAQPKPEKLQNKIKLRRIYRDKKGQVADLSKVVQGDILVVTIEATLDEAMENLVLVDLLPAGFEIDNPRLQSRGDLAFTLEESYSPANADYRDDRVLLFTKSVYGTLYFSYTVRAISPGQFRVPGVLAEAMYDPSVFAKVDDGLTLTVAPKP